MTNLIHGSGSGTGTTTLSGTGTVNNNYADATGALNMFYPSSFSGWTSSGNKSLTDGSTVTPT
jgi:hypothetical protein